MYYGIYKNARNNAWQCILDNKVDLLPVDVLNIADRCNIHVIRNSYVGELKSNEDARTYCNGHKWIIIFNDKNDSETSRFAIAHELGHIFLGHEKTHIKYAHMEQFQKKPKTEQQADMFAIRLLCPACVLWGLNLHTAEEIAQYCRVPFDIAQARAQRMKVLYERGKFLTDPLEKAVYDNFKVHNTKKQKE